MFEDTSDFQTTVERRDSAYAELIAKHQQLLEARGVDRHWKRVLQDATYRQQTTLDAIKENAKIKEQCSEIIIALKKRYVHQTIMEPGLISYVLEKTESLITAPGTPTYHSPVGNENVVGLGPISLAMTNKEKRIAATERYLEEVEACKNLVQKKIDGLAISGPLFDVRVFARDEEQLLLSFIESNEGCNRRIIFHDWQEDSDGDNENISRAIESMLLSVSGISIVLEAAGIKHQLLNPDQYDELLKIAEHLKGGVDSDKTGLCPVIGTSALGGFLPDGAPKGLL
jgi:hypothetical protein